MEFDFLVQLHLCPLLLCGVLHEAGGWPACCGAVVQEAYAPSADHHREAWLLQHGGGDSVQAQLARHLRRRVEGGSWDGLGSLHVGSLDMGFDAGEGGGVNIQANVDDAR